MESHGWEGVIFDTFSLHSGGHIFLSEPIQSLKQEIRVDPEAGQNNWIELTVKLKMHCLLV